MLIQVLPPSGTVTTVENIKLRIGIYHNERDSVILSHIKAATDIAEQFTGRQLLLSTYQLVLPKFESYLYLPKPPLNQIIAIRYFDETDTQQNIDPNDRTKVQIAKDTIGRSILLFSEVLPTADRIDAVTIEFEAGYNSGIPDGIMNAICLMVGGLYQNPVDSVEALPKASTNILRHYRT